MREEELVEKAKEYLKTTYGEDTISMDVLKNEVNEGNGILEVNCTVSWGGQKSDWFKRFIFKNGQVETMTARQR